MSRTGPRDPAVAKAMREAAAAARETWQWRITYATQGKRSKLGQIVMAILGKTTDNPPRIVAPHAYIDSDGGVFTGYQQRSGDVVLKRLCSAEELTANLRKLADVAKLTDSEREAFFAEARKWIWRDLRAETRLA